MTRPEWKAPWWKFWDPASGAAGGMVIGALLWAGMAFLLWLLETT
jgi:hypothetical protein